MRYESGTSPGTSSTLATYSQHPQPEREHFEYLLVATIGCADKMISGHFGAAHCSLLRRSRARTYAKRKMFVLCHGHPGHPSDNTAHGMARHPMYPQLIYGRQYRTVPTTMRNNFALDTHIHTTWYHLWGPKLFLRALHITHCNIPTTRVVVVVVVVYWEHISCGERARACVLWAHGAHLRGTFDDAVP